MLIDMPFAEYILKPAMSSSGLKELARSPAHYKKYITEPRKQTESMLLGSAFHTYLLENDKFNSEYSVIPKLDRRTKDGKIAYEIFMAEAGERKLINLEMFDTIRFMTDSVNNHALAGKLITGGVSEKSFFWTDEESGANCKIRPDYFIEDKEIIVDIKTAQDASKYGFRSSIGKYMYHLQSAFYLEGMGIAKDKDYTNFVHLVVETEAPYNIGIYVLGNLSLQKAEEKIRFLLDIYSKCLNADKWPGYEESLQNIEIPSYLLGDE